VKKIVNESTDNSGYTHIPTVNVINLNHCCMSHNYSEWSQVHVHWNEDNLLGAKFEVLTAVTVKIMDLDVW